MGATNCPETPRQKMIGMMYLVYTAMLAMNVAAEVLSGFATVGEAMDKSNTNIEAKLEDSYNNFQFAYENNKEKVEEYWNKAKEIQSLSNTMVDSIEFFRAEFLCKIKEKADIVTYDTAGNEIKSAIAFRNGTEFLIDSARAAYRHGGLNVLTDPEKSDFNNSTAHFYGRGDEADPACYALRMKNLIIDYKSKVKNILGKDSSHVKIALDVESESFSHHTKKMEPWEQYMFYDVIAAADMVTLSRLVAEVRNCEFDAVQQLYKAVKSNDFSFDKVTVITRPKSGYVIQGGSYETAIGIGAYDSKAHFEVEIGGQKFTSNDSGTVNYKVGASAVGNKTIAGKIYVKKDNNVETYEFHDSYFVAEPVAVVSLTKMNVVYAGIDNPISIGVPGVASKDVSPQIIEGGATIAPDPQGKAGDYIIKANKAGKLKIQINAKIDGKNSKSMGVKDFRVKFIPAPVLQIGKYKTGDRMTKGELTANPTLRAVLPDFDFQLPKLNITSFSFNVQGSGQLDIQGTGNRLTPDMISRINNARRGQKVYITDVTVKTPDGRTHTLDCTLRLN